MLQNKGFNSNEHILIKHSKKIANHSYRALETHIG